MKKITIAMLLTTTYIYICIIYIYVICMYNYRLYAQLYRGDVFDCFHDFQTLEFIAGFTIFRYRTPPKNQ